VEARAVGADGKDQAQQVIIVDAGSRQTGEASRTGSLPSSNLSMDARQTRGELQAELMIALIHNDPLTKVV
jgi:hypothetical protein